MAKARRVYRVADRIQEVVAKELLRVHDPRLQLVTVTLVRVSTDLGHAKVYWSVTGDDARRADAADALEKATPHFRRVLAHELELRFVPELRFFFDDTFETSLRVNQLLQRVANDRLAAEALEEHEKAQEYENTEEQQKQEQD